MPARESKKDFTQIALEVVEATIKAPLKTTPESLRRKNPAAVALSKLGAKKGGLARAAKLSPAKRKQIAKKAAQARWGK